MKLPLEASLDAQEHTCWQMVKLYTQMQDPHGVMDMGAEIQAIRRAKAEIAKVPRETIS